MSGAYCIGSCGGTFHFFFLGGDFLVIFPPSKITDLQELIGRIGLQDFELLLALPEAGGV